MIFIRFRWFQARLHKPYNKPVIFWARVKRVRSACKARKGTLGRAKGFMARGEMTGALRSDFLIVFDKKREGKERGEDPELSGVISLLI